MRRSGAGERSSVIYDDDNPYTPWQELDNAARVDSWKRHLRVNRSSSNAGSTPSRI